MESIILMVLLAVASSIFQSVMQRNKQAKEPDKNVPPVKPKIQPTIKTEKPKALNKTESSKKSAVQIPRVKLEPSKENWETAALMEGMQTEALDDIEIPEQKNTSENREGTGFIQDFSLNDLQRSIIMAEVLGKPKALKRNSR